MSSSGRDPRTGRPSRPSGKSTGSRGASKSYARGRADVRGQKTQSDARRQMYRRRRVTVGVLAIIVAAVLTVGSVLAVQAVQGIRESLAQPVPAANTPDPTAPGPQGDAGSGECPAGSTEVAASTDADEYDVDQQPVLTIEVTNGHGADCIIDVGEGQQEFVIEHEGNTVWSSRYCATTEDDSAKNLLVFPAQSAKKASLTWPRTPVDESCRQTDEAFPAGEYDLVVKLGEKESDSVRFTLAADPADEESGDADDPAGDATEDD